MQDLILYHGTNTHIDAPDILPVKYPLDFGVGFYTTCFFNQAKTWAIRRAHEKGGQAVIYEIRLQAASLSEKLCVCEFPTADEQWLDFVITHRSLSAYQKQSPFAYTPSTEHHRFDIVSGPVADDRVFDVVNLYQAGIYDKAEALRRIVYQRDNHQLVFSTPLALAQITSFKKQVVK